MKSAEILKLLAAKHARDLFVPECKNGSTWFTNGSLRLDAWVMKRSWASPCTIGYEIKVSRQDFLNDNKYRGYLDYCNQFSFVCPPELIQPGELEPEIGLYWTSKNGKMLYTKKKAPYRDVAIPYDLYTYILMCRTKIVTSTMRGDYDNPDTKREHWRQWLKGRTADKELGYMVSCAIRDRVDKVVEDNERLEEENETLREIKSFCESLGVDIRGWRVRDRVQEALAGMPKDFLNSIGACIRRLEEFKEKIEEVA